MAKKAYIGVSDTARNVNKIYVGVNGVARKVVKGYVGVEGVARQFWPHTVPMGVEITTRIYDTHFVVDNVSIQTSIRNYP